MQQVACMHMECADNRTSIRLGLHDANTWICSNFVMKGHLHGPPSVWHILKLNPHLNFLSSNFHIQLSIWLNENN